MAQLEHYQIGPCRLLLVGIKNYPGIANLNESISETDTHIPLVYIDEYPEAGGIVDIEGEKIYYGQKRDRALVDCIRGFLGTTPASHINDCPIRVTPNGDTRVIPDGDTRCAGAGTDVPLYASDLGETHGGVAISVTENVAEIHMDGKGVVPIDEGRTGLLIKVNANLAYVTLESLSIVLRGKGIDSEQGIVIGSEAGKSLLSAAKPLIIVPYIEGSPSSDVEDLIALAKAGMKLSGTIQFDYTNQRVLGVEFTSFKDKKGRICLIGNEVTKLI